MSTITCFDDLSPEVILCIFDYLSPADRYESFFECNSRLRVLVKQRTEFSRKKLEGDILRFSTLHSWYKHLSFDNGGDIYFIIPRKGEQPRYSFDPCVTDSNGLHWWFLYHRAEKLILNEQVRAIITRYPFRLNPFFYHRETKSDDQSSSSRRFDAGNIILMLRRSTLKTWLTINYPEYVDKILNRSDADLNEDQCHMVSIFDGEWLKVTTAINIATVQIWNELKELDDINPLQIEFKD
jgi:hypothetical protein